LELSKRNSGERDPQQQHQPPGIRARSEFIVRLPVVHVPNPQDSQVDGEPAKAQVRRRILVVDDNRDSADSLAMMLKLLGHEVATAHDGLQAVEMVGTFQPDVALLDLGMPKLNGYDAARRIRAKWGNNSPVLIALTGWGQEEDRRRSQEAGFDYHLTKPVELAALEELLAKVALRRARCINGR
jgi:CheY-like chemotaxis protein